MTATTKLMKRREDDNRVWSEWEEMYRDGYMTHAVGPLRVQVRITCSRSAVTGKWEITWREMRDLAGEFKFYEVDHADGFGSLAAARRYFNKYIRTA